MRTFALGFFLNCFAAKNNFHTRHLAKLLFHLACYLQESMSTSGVPPLVYEKAANAVYISSVFLKHLIESGMQLYLSFDGDEAGLKSVMGGMYKCMLDFTFEIYRLEP
jgi:hypothetical protein